VDELASGDHATRDAYPGALVDHVVERREALARFAEARHPGEKWASTG